MQVEKGKCLWDSEGHNALTEAPQSGSRSWEGVGSKLVHTGSVKVQNNFMQLTENFCSPAELNKNILFVNYQKKKTNLCFFFIYKVFQSVKQSLLSQTECQNVYKYIYPKTPRLKSRFPQTQNILATDLLTCIQKINQ